MCQSEADVYILSKKKKKRILMQTDYVLYFQMPVVTNVISQSRKKRKHWHNRFVGLEGKS